MRIVLVSFLFFLICSFASRKADRRKDDSQKHVLTQAKSTASSMFVPEETEKNPTPSSALVPAAKKEKKVPKSRLRHFKHDLVVQCSLGFSLSANDAVILSLMSYYYTKAYMNAVNQCGCSRNFLWATGLQFLLLIFEFILVETARRKSGRGRGCILVPVLRMALCWSPHLMGPVGGSEFINQVFGPMITFFAFGELLLVFLRISEITL